MVLLKTLNDIFSACDRFMLKIFFYGVKIHSNTFNKVLGISLSIYKHIHFFFNFVGVGHTKKV